MSSRDYYKLYSKRSDHGKFRNLDTHDVLDNDTEFNANQFKLYDDFTTDLRINFNPLRQNYHDVARTEGIIRRVGDPNDSGVDMENGNIQDDVTPSKDSDLLENEVMVDPWSSMDSSNSPLTDSGPSASEDCTPSTSSEPNRGAIDLSSPVSSEARRILTSKITKPAHVLPSKLDKARSRDLTLDLETVDSDPISRRTHFLDDDFPPPVRSNIECRIPKPHFLDHSPSPDEFDEKSDITNPNFLDDDVDGDDSQAQKKCGALPKKQQKTTTYTAQEHRPHRTTYRTALHYNLESVVRSSEQDKRASQLYRGTWPGERDVWTGRDSSSVRSFSSSGSTEGPRSTSNLENKMECVCSLISLLSLSPENNADLSGPLLDMSRSVESCIAMRQAGCIPLLVQLIHSKVPRETRDRAAKALRNIIHTQTDDKAGRREARVWRLLEQVREYCYVLEDVVEARKEGREIVEDDAAKHPSQSVAALMKLSFDEEHRHVVCQLGGLQALASLVSGDQAAHGSRTDDNTCLTMRKYAGMTLTNLTFGDGNNKSLLCSFKDFMLALVEQLESPNDDMLQVTAAVLRNLSWRADTNSKQVLREVGTVKGLTKAAMTCKKEATLKSVLSALWNLTAHCSMNKVAVCSVEGALGFLVDMLSFDSPTKSPSIVENSGGIIRNVSSHIAVREDYRQILRERNCLSVLLQHLKSPSLTIVSNSCGTLWNLSARCPQDQQFLWDHGAVPMLRSLIHSKHKMISMGSSAALKNLLNSKPGKTYIISLDSTARNMNLPALPTLGARKQKAIEQELDQNLAETCDNIEPATSPSTSNREEKNLFIATERQIAMNLERHRMTSSSPLMGTLTSQISLSHSAHLASYLSCSNTLLKGALITRSNTGSAGSVNRSDSKDSVTSTHSDSVFERVMRTGKVPVPTPRNKDLMKNETTSEVYKMSSERAKENYVRYPTQPPVPPPRSSTELRTNYTESGFDVDQDSCDQPIDFSQKYPETKTIETESEKPKGDTAKKYTKKESSSYGDYQETDLDQPTDYSLRYAEHQSETGSDISETVGPSVHEDTIKHFATEGTPYETPAIFSTATSMSDLRIIGKDIKTKSTPSVKENPEAMTHSDEKDTCSIEDPPRHDNDRAASTPQATLALEPIVEKSGVFDTKFSSGMISPEKPVNYCDEGTPGYFSRVSSLSSLGELNEGENLAKKNAMATINVDPSLPEAGPSGSSKDKEGSKAVTFASEPVAMGGETVISGQASARTSSPQQRFVEETPLMFSRSSSLGSLPECSQHDDQGSVLSEVSRLTSGCISPSEIPDSPCAGAALSPPPAPRARDSTAPSTPPQEGQCVGSVFEERVSRFVVEHTPAQFSAATSLSSLTIDDEPKQQKLKVLSRDVKLKVTTEPNVRRQVEVNQEADERGEIQPLPISNAISSTAIKAEPQTPGEVCRVYCTEDTPALLSKAGSNSNLSALSVDSAPPPCLPRAADPTPQQDAHDTSDSSNLSDAADLLEECIQKGIAKVVKNKGPPSDTSSNFYRDDVYRSLPPYLRSSTETVKMSQEFARNIRDSRSPSSERGSPPPLPPKTNRVIAPPRPPQPAHSGRRHESRLPVKSRPQLPFAGDLARNDSLSSLSLDSFGSTDREIFEETVKAGLSSVNPRARYTLDSTKGKAHSVERPAEFSRHVRSHKSLDRSDRISGRSSARTRTRRIEQDLAEPSGASRRGRREDISLEKSSSLSSISNESFGSTDKEVFERCVRQGMSRTQHKHGSPAGLPAAPPGAPPNRGALDLMTGDGYSRERALLEEVIARGAHGNRSKNVRAPSADRAAAGERATPAPDPQPRHTGCDGFTQASGQPQPTSETDKLASINLQSPHQPQPFSETDILVRITVQSPRQPRAPLETYSLAHDTLQSPHQRSPETDILARSNECLAPTTASANTTFESDRGELDRSNESCADVLDGSWSDSNSAPEGKAKQEWTDIRTERQLDTWNDNTCPDDVTFPTISGSVHIVLSNHHSEGTTLPDLLEKSERRDSRSRPDLTDKLDDDRLDISTFNGEEDRNLCAGIPGRDYECLEDENEQKFDSIISAAIEKEAARLAAQLKNSQYVMENSVTSLNSIDLDKVKPPSNLGSLLSLSASNWDESLQVSKKTQRSRKKSLPIDLVKRAVSNSMNQGSTEYLDSSPASFLDNIKPPSEMENIDMEGSMVSVSSLVSEVADTKEKTTLIFDFKQPVQDFPLCNALNIVYHDLDKVNPPSLFDEMAESTLEIEQTTAQQIDDCVSNTLNVVTDIPSGSENCTPLPSDISSVESTPKRTKDPKYLTPKEKRQISKDRYQTYTITDSVIENDTVMEVKEEYLTWTKSESDKSEEYLTSTPEPKSKRKLSAKQRRVEDRSRYQTQIVDIHNILAQEPQDKGDQHLESLKQRLASKKTMKQKRLEDAERFRTRTLSEDIPPSPTFVTKDANFENVETTTGYDSLSSNELNHQLLPERSGDDDVFSKDVDSGHNEDDFELHSAKMQTYTRSFRNYLPVIESPAAVDMCVVYNLKNLEMTASYNQTLPTSKHQNPSTSDFASFEGDSNSEDKALSESDPETRPKPKIIKPSLRREDTLSLDSNESLEREQETAKAIRGRKKAMYVSPYRRSSAPPKKMISPPVKTPKSAPLQKGASNPIRAHTSAKMPNKSTSKPTSANTSPKKSAPNRSSSTIVHQKPISIPLTAKPLPLERQGTFTKEESSVPARDLPAPDKSNVPKGSKVSANPKDTNTSPSRLPQPSRFAKPPAVRTQKPANKVPKRNEPVMKNSPSNHSLQSNESGRTVTIASRTSRHSSISSVNSSKANEKTTRKIIDQAQRQAKAEKKVLIGTEKDTPKLIRSSTFDSQPKLNQVPPTPKQKTAIGMRVSQIPSLRPKSTPAKIGQTATKKPSSSKPYVRKQVNGQLTT